MSSENYVILIIHKNLSIVTKIYKYLNIKLNFSLDILINMFYISKLKKVRQKRNMNSIINKNIFSKIIIGIITIMIRIPRLAGGP